METLLYCKHCKMRTVITFFSLLLICFPVTESDERSHRYEKDEIVLLWMNTVGPYHNKQETYPYFQLPFCGGPKGSISFYHETLAETLLGNELQFSGLDISFKVNTAETSYCEIEVTEERFNAFAYAIKNQFWYQMYIDDLPMWGIVGMFYESDNSYYLWTHRTFYIGYNGDQIVDVNVSSEANVKLEKGTRITFSYSVIWIPSTVKFEDRFDNYLDPTFMQHRLHWFSIVNSFILALFLIGLVSKILKRTLHINNFNYRKDEPDDMVRDLEDDCGWKQIHGNVFRPPVHPMMFTVLIGTGYQLIATILCVVAFTIIGKLYTVRGSVLSTLLFVYAATASINGYFGGSLYAKMGGKRWMRQVAYSAFLLPFLVSMITVLINFIAIYYRTSRVIPFGMMVDVIGLCLFVIFPLTLVGTILGRSVSGQPNHPCPIDAVPRPIPKRKWFQQPAVSACLGGMLPFGSIFVALYFILTSFWDFKIYYVYGFLLLSFFVLAIITACITVVITYFLLNAQDYRWQWTSFLSGASTGLYVYMYSIYFFFYKTEMYGFFQTAFYFGYMGVFSSVVGIICGAFGYVGANQFVKKIYSVHCETEMLKEIFTLQLNQDAPSENGSISFFIKTAVHEMKNKWRNLQSSYVARKFLGPQKKTFSNMDEICAKALLDGESSDKSDTSRACESCAGTGLQTQLDALEDPVIEKGLFINDPSDSRERQNLDAGKTEMCGSSSNTPTTTVCESNRKNMNMHDDMSCMQEKV